MQAVAVPGGIVSEPISINLQFADLLARHPNGGMVCLCGPDGSGKTLAIEHLAATLPDDAGVVLRDDHVLLPHHHALKEGALVVCTARKPLAPLPQRLVAVLRMSPWTRDDVIEYVLAAAGQSARGVLKRALASDGVDRLEGCPELWRIVLDEMIADSQLLDVRGALLGWLRRNVLAWEAACTACMDAFWMASKDQSALDTAITGVAALARQPVLRQRYAQVLLAGQKLASELADIESSELLEAPLPLELVAEAGRLARARPGAVEHLQRIIAGTATERHATAATILVSADPCWRPEDGSAPFLFNATLGPVNWQRLRLCGAELRRADLHHADLSDAVLEKTPLTGANLAGAKLRRAVLTGVLAEGANFSGADLSRVRAAGAFLEGADLSGATLDGAELTEARLESANLQNASLVAADLSDAVLRRAKIDDADLTAAKFIRADLRGLRLNRAASLDRAVFRNAMLARCDFEGLELDRPDFEAALMAGALLTGSRLNAAAFAGADLRNTGLAEIDWEDADLRGANLAGASFHLGTTRSGMIFGAPPCGSRTGYYTDEYQERDFLAPEQIRKANLCGADLRGAIIDGVDFYLVDLRGASYTPEQKEHFQRCGAILCDRSA